jgi:hypothetical protein
LLLPLLLLHQLEIQCHTPAAGRTHNRKTAPPRNSSCSSRQQDGTVCKQSQQKQIRYRYSSKYGAVRNPTRHCVPQKHFLQHHPQQDASVPGNAASVCTNTCLILQPCSGRPTGESTLEISQSLIHPSVLATGIPTTLTVTVIVE